MVMRRWTSTSTATRGNGPDGGSSIRELDRVRLLSTVVSDDRQKVPMGSEGTVVAIYANGEAFEVEFVHPFEALATVDGRSVLLIQRGGE
ncbi:DUF4926 domain-containing protein [Methylobacterium sp. A54F]